MDTSGGEPGTVRLPNGRANQYTMESLHMKLIKTIEYEVRASLWQWGEIFSDRAFIFLKGAHAMYIRLSTMKPKLFRIQI